MTLLLAAGLASLLQLVLVPLLASRSGRDVGAWFMLTACWLSGVGAGGISAPAIGAALGASPSGPWSLLSAALVLLAWLPLAVVAATGPRPAPRGRVRR